MRFRGGGFVFIRPNHVGEFDHFKLTLSLSQKNSQAFQPDEQPFRPWTSATIRSRSPFMRPCPITGPPVPLALTNAFSGSITPATDFSNRSATLTENLVFSGTHRHSDHYRQGVQRKIFQRPQSSSNREIWIHFESHSLMSKSKVPLLWARPRHRQRCRDVTIDL